MKISFPICTAVAFLINCATLFGVKEKSISVQTTPEGAAVSLYAANGAKIFEGISPCKIQMHKEKLVDGKVVIQKPQFRDIEVNLGRKVETLAFANICCLFPPLVVLGGAIDYFGGNFLTPEKTDINIILEPLEQKKIPKEKVEIKK
ncbi:MAG: hypothetical protein N2316_07185 [Spirochaetes bacterium]|nr:hypothetical protein [Spirochaetota bacterium]